MQMKRTTTMWVSLVMALFCLLLASTQARGQAVAGYSEYFVPGDELNMYYIFTNLDVPDCTPANTTMHSVISVTAWSPNTTVYYEHWENGYHFDPNNPGATTDEMYTIANAGGVLVFESNSVPSQGPPPAQRSGVATTCPGQLNPLGVANGNRCYDGGDHIYVAGGSVTVTRATWVQCRGAGNQGDAWEVYPVEPQLTTYVLPFGENLYTNTNYFLGFQRVYALIQATDDNTTVTVDLNNDGVPDVLNQNRGATWNGTGPGTVSATNGSPAVVGAGGTTFLTSVYPNQPMIINGVEYVVASVTDNTHLTLTANYAGTTGGGLTYRAGEGSTIYLNKGQTFLLDRVSACPNHGTCTTNPGTLNSGAVITGNKTLQVKYVAGRTGTTYCARGLSAFPRGLWTKSYYGPFSQAATASKGVTDYYLFNPWDTALTVNWQTLNGSSSFSIPANSTESFNHMLGANPSVPQGSGVYFSADREFWGVGFGDASNNQSTGIGGNPSGQGYEWGFSLLPVSLLFHEHFLGWAPGSLPLLTAPINGNSVFLTVAQDNTRVFVDYTNDGVADQTYTLNRLQSQFIPANPATGTSQGARYWATGDFTMAYGENADTATTPTPNLDLGYVALPGADYVSTSPRRGCNSSSSP